MRFHLLMFPLLFRGRKSFTTNSSVSEDVDHLLRIRIQLFGQPPHLFDILWPTFDGNTRRDANLQIEGAFWFIHHNNYPVGLSDIEAGSIRRVDFADGKGSVLESFYAAHGIVGEYRDS